jgi:hypothetical protein
MRVSPYASGTDLLTWLAVNCPDTYSALGKAQRHGEASKQHDFKGYKVRRRKRANSPLDATTEAEMRPINGRTKTL